MYNGVINVYKEKGFTSHDVVNRLRRILSQKKIGHTGTLDPDATGVLPICVGSGTRLCEGFTEHDKEYVADLLLGVRTDTQDMSGTILEEKEPVMDESLFRSCVAGFVGEIEQVPPMYSALKVNGQKLCDLARKGVEVERKARKIRIYEIEILSLELPRARLRVKCSRGTYIRTLCDDIGRSLGCGAAMEALERTMSGEFAIGQTHTLGEIARYMEEGRIEELITPVDEFFSGLPAGYIGPEEDLHLHNGNPIQRTAIRIEGADPEQGVPQQLRMYDSKRIFAGIYKRRGRSYYPEKMFLTC